MTTEGEPRIGTTVQAKAGGRVDPALLYVHAPVLLAAARAIVMNEAEAEDLVQTTLEIGLRRIGQLRDPAALRGWLLAIETREAFRLVRRLRQWVRLDIEVAEPVVTTPDPTDAIQVRHALASLPRRMRAAVVLHHLVGLSVAETAVALGVRDNTVKSQLKVGLSRLRAELGHE